MKDRKRHIEKENTSGKQQRTAVDSTRKASTSAKTKNKPAVSEEDDEDCEDSEEENDVSRALFYYADSVIAEGLQSTGMEEELMQAKKALEKCKFLLLHQNPLLSKMLKKACSRDMSDNKVPPGSASVLRDLEDDRFLLSLVCINCSKLEAIGDQNFASSIRSLREALVFFPRSAEANENIAQLLRIQADTQEKLNSVENHLRKAGSCKEQILASLKSAAECSATLSLLAKEAEKQTSTSSSDSNKVAVNFSESFANKEDLKKSSTSKINDDSNGMKVQKEGDGESESENENDDDDDADMLEEEMQFKVLNRELDASVRATEKLSLLLCQENRCDEAEQYLTGSKYVLRLSRDVLCYQIPDEEIKNTNDNNDMEIVQKSSIENDDDENDNKIESKKYVRVTDNMLTPSFLTHLQHVFRPTSPFWSEHQYDSTVNSSRTSGYFSYAYNLRDSPTNSIEQAIQILYRKVKEMFPGKTKSVCGENEKKVGRKKNEKNEMQKIECDVTGGEVEKNENVKDRADVEEEGDEECLYAEWWVHTRPHTSGHQMHFDSDNEGLTRSDGKPVHPVCSTVLYLQEGVGGPTLVTDQVLGGNLAERGWMCFPKTNRLAIFDAKYLHGVIPGKGKNPDPDSRRLTLMVGFWKNLRVRNSTDVQGPNQIFPGVHSRYTWHNEMTIQNIEQGTSFCSKNSTEVFPLLVEPIWEHVKKENNQENAKNETDGKEKTTDEKVDKRDKTEKNEKNEKSEKSEKNEEEEKSSIVSTDLKLKLNLKVKLPSCVSYDKCFQGF